MKSTEKKQPAHNQAKSNAKLGMLWQLEPRIMFDGAAAITVIDTINQDSSLLNESVGIKSLFLDEVEFSNDDSNSQDSNKNELEQWLANYQLPLKERDEIVFVDTSVEGYKTILSGIKPGIQVVLLDSSQDGVEQIATTLSDRTEIDAIHLISHGDAGTLQVGTGTLTTESMTEQYADELATIRQALSEQADILVYGCDFAEGDAGQDAVTLLSQLTGADVAASTDATGAAIIGGDWTLETQTGAIETHIAVTDALQMDWVGLLDITTGLLGNWTFDTNANDSSGNNYNGTLTNGAAIDTTDATDIVGVAKLSLDGVNDYVDLSAHSANLAGLTQGTIAGWIKTTSTFETIFSISDTADTGSSAALFLGASGYLTYEVRENGVLQLAVYRSSSTINDGNWHHIAVTVGASGNSLYVDGVLATAGQLTYDAGNATTQVFFSSVTSLDSMAIGGTQGSGGGTWYTTGLIDDVRVYDRVLTGGDIAQLYATSNDAPTDITFDSESTIEQIINTYTTSDQIDPAIAAFDDGGYVVVWVSNGQDGSGYGIYGQRYHADGTANGTEFLVTSETGDSETGPSVSTFADGGFVVVWQDQQTGVYAWTEARVFNADGTAATAEFKVSPGTNGNAEGYQPSVLALDTNRFVVVWSNETGGTTYNLAGRIYNRSGVLQGSQFTIGSLQSGTALFGAQSELTLLNDGGFAATWRTWSTDDAHLRIMNSDGSARSVDIALSGDHRSDVTTLRNGNVVVVYGSGTDILGRIYDASGTLITGPFTVNTSTAGTQLEPTITHSDDGFVVAWQSDTGDGSSTGIYVQRFDATGNRIDGETLVNTTISGAQSVPELIATRSGQVRMVWQSENVDGSGYAVVSRVVATGTASVAESAANGTRVADLLGVFDIDNGDTATYSLVDSAGGRFAVNATTGVITVANSSLLDYEANSSHQITVRATDSGGLTRDEILTISVTNVNDAPVITSLSGDSLVYSEGAGAVVIEQGGNALAADVDSTNLDTGTLTISIPSGGDSTEDVLSIQNQGTGAGQIGVSGSNVTYGGVTIGTFTGGSNGTSLVITLNSSADATTVTALIKNITYENTDAAASTIGARTVRYVLTDGDGGTSANYDTTVTVSAVNDAPVLADSGLTFTVFEDAGTPVNGTAVGSPLSVFTGSITDSDGAVAKGIAIVGSTETDGTWYYTTDAGATWLTVGAVSDTASLLLADTVGTRLYFAPNSNYNGNVFPGLIVRAWDQSSGAVGTKVDTSVQGGSTAFSVQGDTIDPTVIAVNDAPVFGNLDGTPTFTEGGVPVLLDANVTFTDPELSALNGGAGDYFGSSILLERNGGPNANDVFSATGNLSPLIEGTSLVLSGVTIGHVTTNSGGTLLITFDHNATSARVNEAVQSIAYSNSSEAPSSSVVINWASGDGNDGSQGTGGVLGASGSTTVTITTVNDAPVLADTVLTLTVAEDAGAPSGAVGSTISTFTGGITDVDSGAAKGIAITGTNETNGIWYYTTNGGSTWTAVSAVSNTSALLLADNASTRLYFAPSADYNGTSTGALTFRAWDQTSGTAGTKVSTASNGGTTAFSSATDTIDVSVTAVNDAPTFGVGDGQATTSFGSGWEFGKETLLQPDGKILVAGYSDSGGSDDFSLTRYNADGTLDTSFGGGDGIALAGIVGRAETAVLQPDGKIVLSGYTTDGGYQVCLVQFNADGTLDTSFGGGDGVASSGVFGSAKDVALQTDGKFLVAADLSNSNFNLMRFNSDGSLDTSFGGGSGYVSTDLAGGNDRADSLTIQSDGKVILAGFGFNGTSFDFALVRYNTDGSLDTSFNGTGKVLTDFGGNSSDTGNEVRVQADGKIVVAGWSDTGGTNDFAIARYNANGTLDTGFGTGGQVTIDLGGSDLAEGLTIQADGKILVTGTAGINGNDFGLVRLNTDGSLDTTFSGDGVATTDYTASSDDRAYSVTAQNDGQIVVSGTSKVGALGDYNYALTRYTSTGALDTTLDPVNTLDGAPTFTEGGSPVVLDGDVQIFDAELSALNNFNGATLTLARNGGANAEDQLVFDGVVVTVSGPAVSVSGVQVGTYTFTGGEMTITFNGNATQARVNTLMQHILYSNVSDASPDSAQINWTFSDGNSGSQGSGGALTATGSTTVTITAVNDAPTITNLSGDSLAYSEGDGAVIIEQGGNALVADVDSTNFDTGTLTVSFTAGSDSAEDVLSIRNQGIGAGQIGVSGSNITYGGTVIGTYAGGSGGGPLVITFNSNATPTVVTALTQHITYENTDTAATTTGVRTIRYVLSDGDGGTSANYDTAVTVSGVNDAPVNTVPGAQTVTEDTSLAIPGISVSDADGNLSTVQLSVSHGTLTVTLSGGATISSGTNGSGTLTISGSQAAINTTLASLVYQGNVGYVGADTLTVLSTDSQGASDSDTVSITVATGNVAPINSVPGAQSAVENTSLAISSISVADGNGDLASTQLSVSHGTLTVTLSGGATISSGTNGSGTLTISGSQAAINTTLASLVYQGNVGYVGADTLTVLSTDSQGASDSDTVSITVATGNVAPINSVPGAQSAVENTSLAISSISVADGNGDLASTQLSVSHGTLTVTLSGGATISSGTNGSGTLTISGSQAAINTTLASLVYQGNVGYVGADTLTVLSTDSQGASDSDTVSITVATGNVAPINSVPGAQSAVENTSLAISSISVADGNGDLASTQLSVSHGTLTVTLSGGATISSGTNGSGTLTISGSQAAINTTLASLVYQGNVGYVGADTLTVLSTDSQGASDSDTVSITVATGNVAPINSVPGAQSAVENTSLAISSISVADGNGDLASTQLSVSHGTLTVTLSGGATISSGTNGSGTLTISGSQAAINTTLASLVYQGNVGYVGADTLTVLSTDSQGASDSDTVSITVATGNVAPINSVPGAQSAVENTSLAISSISVADGNGDLASTQLSVSHGTLTVTLSGGATISSGTNGSGTLTISGSQAAINTTLASLVYQGNVGYVGADTLTVLSTDSQGASDSDTVSITVATGNVAPINSVPGAQSAVENTSLAISSISVADGNGDLASTQLSVSHGTLTVTLSGGATISSGTNGSGTLTISGSQAAINTTLASLVYQGNVGYVGADTLTVLSTDSQGASDSDTVSITVATGNVAPINSVPGAQSAVENTSLAISSISVADGNGDLASTQLSVSHGTLTVTLSGGATISSGTNGSGTLTISGSQAAINTTLASLVYQGNVGYVGADTLTVLSTDSQGASDSDTVSITVATGNVAPINSVPGAQSAVENTSLAISSISVADGNGDLASTQLSVSHGTLTVTLSGGATISSGANGSGTLTISGNQAAINTTLASLVYQGNVGYVGADTLTVLSTDSQGASDSDTVSITVATGNVAPINSVPGAQSAVENTSLAISSISVADGNGDLASTQLSVSHGTLTVTLSGGATISSGANGSGTLTISGNQAAINTTLASLVYQGNVGYVGADTLTVLSTDSQGASDSDTVSITVATGNVAPINSVPGAQSAVENTSLAISSISVADGNGDLASTQLSVSHGTLTVTLSGGATISSGANGSGTLTISGNQAAINTTLASLVYQGNVGYVGADTLTVLSTDSQGASDSDTVSITVATGNVAPINSVPGAQSAVENTSLAISSISVADGNGDLASTQLSVSHGTLTVTLSGGATISSGANGSGTLTISGNQAAINTALASLVYQGNVGYVGADTLTVLSTDSQGASDSDTASILVSSNVLNLQGQNDYFVIKENSTLTIGAPGVLSNDGAYVTNSVIAILSSAPAYGVLVFNKDGSFSYTPNSGYIGTDSFIYRITNGATTSGLITVALVIEPIVLPLPEVPTGPIVITPPAIPVSEGMTQPGITPIAHSSSVNQLSPTDLSNPIQDISSIQGGANLVNINNTVPPFLTEDKSRSPMRSNEQIQNLTRAINSFRLDANNYNDGADLKENASKSKLLLESEALLSNTSLVNQIDKMHKTINDSFQQELSNKELSVKIVSATGISFTAVIVSWLMRAGSLAASLFTFLPAWKSVDPLSILVTKTKKPKEDTEKKDDQHKNHQIETDKSENIFISEK